MCTQSMVGRFTLVKDSLVMLSNKVLTLFPWSYLLKIGNDRGLQIHPLTNALYKYIQKFQHQLKLTF